MEKKANQWLKYCIILFLPLFILLLSFKTTIFFTEYTPKQQNAVDYLQEKTELQGNYTAAERSHMEDVQKVFNKGNTLFWILALVIILTLTYLKKEKDLDKQIFFKSGLLTISSIILLLLAIFLNFNSIFTLFHNIFFPQGNWQFPLDSFLIQTFPLEFITKMSILIFSQALGWGILFILISLLLKHEMVHQQK